ARHDVRGRIFAREETFHLGLEECALAGPVESPLLHPRSRDEHVAQVLRHRLACKVGRVPVSDVDRLPPGGGVALPSELTVVAVGVSYREDLAVLVGRDRLRGCPQYLRDAARLVKDDERAHRVDTLKRRGIVLARLASKCDELVSQAPPGQVYPSG